MNTSSNYSDIRFGIQNNAVRYSWALYFLLGILSSLIGDTLILVASLREDAFKIKKFLVVIIQHIAISDLANTLTFLIPTEISLLTNSWVLGDTLCYIRAYTAYMMYLAGMSLIAVLTTSKFLILRYPLRAVSWSDSRAHQVCSLVWVSSLIMPILFFAVDKDDVHFDYRVYNCQYKLSSDVWKKALIPITGFVYGIVPNVVVVTTTILTLKYLADAMKFAKRVQGSVPWQGAVTVPLTSLAYCVSTLPYVVHRIASRYIHEDPPGLFHLQFYRIFNFLLMINVAANFYIYALTIRSFRSFLYSKVLSMVPFVRLACRNEASVEVDGGNVPDKLMSGSEDTTCRHSRDADDAQGEVTGAVTLDSSLLTSKDILSAATLDEERHAASKNNSRMSESLV